MPSCDLHEHTNSKLFLALGTKHPHNQVALTFHRTTQAPSSSSRSSSKQRQQRPWPRAVASDSQAYVLSLYRYSCPCKAHALIHHCDGTQQVELGGTTWLLAIAVDDPQNIVAQTRIDTTTPDETLTKAIDWLKTQTFDSIGASVGPMHSRRHVLH